MKNIKITIADYIDYYRMCLATWVHPETGENSRKYKLLLSDLKEVETVVGKNIPEVKDTAQWVLGRNYERTILDEGQNVDLKLMVSAYPSYAKYKSLIHFKDVLENDYKRKLK